MNIQENADYFKYLFELRESGETNMFGAGADLEDAFDLEKKQAREIVRYWMKNFDLVASELGIEV